MLHSVLSRYFFWPTLPSAAGLCIFLLILGCSSQSDPSNTIFTNVPVASSGVDFENTLSITDTTNFFKYGYFYMGGGVAAGDLNGDGLSDLFFTANMEANRLYLNRGELQFEDITEAAGVFSVGKWHTGCSFHDFNNDGKLDISVAVAGIWAERSNLIYLNTGNDERGIPQFVESAEAMGLADGGYSIQTAYIDYDQDGDLDVYVVNYPPTEFNTTVAQYEALLENVRLENSDHLYRNNGDGTYSDVTEAAGLLRFGLGIGVIASDINQDGWTDLYVSNDFHTPDFFYLNNGDGTFREAVKDCFPHTSFFGMGVDVADLNNDLLPDLFQVDMTTTDNYRSKANMSSMNIPAFWAGIEAGFGYQYMFNSLQINNGLNPQGDPFFSDIAMANQMQATEWSWACLLSDWDLDGRTDVFISNGTRKEINNKDYFKWLKQTDTKLKVKFQELNFVDLTNELPEVPTDNFIFRNTGNQFEKANDFWNLHFEGFSNGATYADLDNDGDLELILNNIDSTATIFENLASEQKNYLAVQLAGPSSNPLGLGAKLILRTGNQQIYHEHTLVRGYQSSVDPRIHFGLNDQVRVDYLEIEWPDGKREIRENLAVNQRIALSYENASVIPKTLVKEQSYFTLDQSGKLVHTHLENDYDDYQREILIPHKMSSLGPKVAVGDINHDSVDDVVVPGPQGQATTLYLSEEAGYRAYPLSAPEKEDVFASFADVDGDQKLDLIVASGGNEVDDLQASYYSQRFYSDVQLLAFSESQEIAVDLRQSASLCLTQDINENGVPEVYLFGRQIPGHYPSPPSSFVFEHGEEMGASLAPELNGIGMVTDAVWTDYDGDQDMDLMVCGEWMGIEIFENQNGKLNRIQTPLNQQIGWWKDIEQADFDGDGDLDFIVANLGLNYKYQASETETFDIYAKDFDRNEKPDIILSYFQEGNQYPVRGRQCSSEQMPILTTKFPSYHSFANSTVQDIYGDQELAQSLHYQANNFQHLYIENLGDGTFAMVPLAAPFQRYSFNSIATNDINKDGHLDIVLVGNIFDSEVETPRSDAGYGILALGDGNGTFRIVPNHQSGLYVPYEAQDVRWIKDRGQEKLLVVSNNAPIQVYQWQETAPQTATVPRMVEKDTPMD
ncbi:MAG: CRTAC1 family protein [Bacteroidota bacterium]